MTRIFDSHCDTVIKVVEEGIDLTSASATTHITIPKLKENGVKLQVFACFAAEMEYGSETPRRSRTLINRVLQLAELPSLYRPRTVAELHDCLDGEDVGILPAIEGGEALGGDPARVREMKQHGVVYITLAWSDNDLTGSSFGENRGLSTLGKEVVSEMLEHNILVDVSHMSDAAFEDLVMHTSRPFIASHSNCRSVCKAMRNQTDEQIREIGRRGGVIGINFVGAFLSDDVLDYQTPHFERFFSAVNAGHPDAKKLHQEMNQLFAKESPRATLDDVIDHIEHAVDLAGHEHVALGSDFDGYEVGVDAFDDCSGYQMVIERMQQRGFSEDQIEAIAWKNWLRMFSSTFM
jgi:membrane dipeptidase